MKYVIVPLDGSERAERSLAHGAALAGQLHAELVLVTHRRGGVVVDPRGYLADRAAAVGHPGGSAAASPTATRLPRSPSSPTSCPMRRW